MVEGGGENRFLLPLPLPRHSFFFCSCPSFLDEPREETLATQANVTGWKTASHANKSLDIRGILVILWCSSNISILIFILNSKIALIFETEMLN